AFDVSSICLTNPKVSCDVLTLESRSVSLGISGFGSIYNHTCENSALWSTLSHPWFPLVILFICSYQIANCFLSVYEMTIDTIMLCCAEELVLLRDNPEAVQQFRDFMDGTSEVMAQRNVQLIGCTRIEETYPLNPIDGERK
ncbi:hypothetical protein ANCDUO_12118, partial [Ancylostoma duodenale]